MASGVCLTAVTCGMSQWLVLLTYGLMFGIGVGLCYSAPFVCAMRWLGPRRVGIAVGLVEAGFGAGAFIFNQVQTAIVNPHNRPRTVIPYNDSAHGFNTEERYFAAEDVEHVPHMFLVLAVVYGAMQFAACLCMSNPPGATKHERSINAEEVEPFLPSAATAVPPAATTIGLSASGMLKTRQFWTIWGLFSLNSFNIVAVASLNKVYGQTIPGLDDHFLSWVGSFGSLCNGLGRIFWGGLADRLSFRTAIVALSACFAAVVGTLWLTPHLGRNAFLGWICAAFFCLGGNFSMFPSVTAKNFGTVNAGPNYGIVFTATIASGLVGAFYLKAHHPTTQEQWREVLVGFGSMSAVAALLGLTYRPGHDSACGRGGE
jgi:MFS family permease